MARTKKRSCLARSQRSSGSKGFTSRLIADIERLEIVSDYIPSDRELTCDNADNIGDSPNALSLSDDSDVEILLGPPIASGLGSRGGRRGMESGPRSESGTTDSEYEADSSSESASEEVLSVINNKGVGKTTV